MRGNDRVFRFEQMCNQHHRGHAGIGNHGTVTTFEPGNRICQNIPGRVAAAGVIVLTFATKTFETEVGRQIDRRHHRSILTVSINACTNRRGNFLMLHDDRLVSINEIKTNLIGNSGEAVEGEPAHHVLLCCLLAHFPVALKDSAGVSTYYGMVSPEGCPGVKGPVPQPVSMSVNAV